MRLNEVIESEYTDIYAISLIINLRRISHQRHCYCVFLSEMVKRNIVGDFVVILMKEIANRYDSLRTSLIKQIMKKRINNSYINIIDDIIVQEHTAYENMKSFI